jgi:hypothetical protein
MAGMNEINLPSIFFVWVTFVVGTALYLIISAMILLIPALECIILDNINR